MYVKTIRQFSFKSQTGGKRKRGRPRLRSWDGVLKDLEINRGGGVVVNLGTLRPTRGCIAINNDDDDQPLTLVDLMKNCQMYSELRLVTLTSSFLKPKRYSDNYR
ncbi:unnamed protein product [Pieris macdunnoughi]|uniref:Uncharacterized protein n=1 Tax=Pieris macdunnoughi TaxID=345717 RepID=A0A821NEF5_9NEOP|nr:unnamed protein product [Pieris macdunnoughi]